MWDTATRAHKKWKQMENLCRLCHAHLRIYAYLPNKGHLSEQINADAFSGRDRSQLVHR